MAQAKILIADDDTLVREAVHKILNMFGHEVTPCASGEEAIAAINSDFDLIILDINMPGLDGFETWAPTISFPSPSRTWTSSTSR